MLLSILSKLLASLLVVAVTLAALALLLGQTLLSSHYIENQLSATNSYNKLSAALVAEISTHQDTPLDQATKDKLQTVLTPVVLQQKIDLTLEQLQSYYNGSATVPVIDVSDLVAHAQAAGLPIGSDNNLSKPITLSGASQIKGVGKQFNTAKWAATAIAALFALLLLLVSWKRHRWAAMPDVLINVGVLLGIFTVIFAVGPAAAQHFLKFNTASNAFATIGRDLALSITHDLAKRLGIVAVSYFVIGVSLRIIWGRHHRKQTPAFLKQK